MNFSQSVKRQTVSFISDNPDVTFTPVDKFWRNIYRFKAIRINVINPKIRISNVNDALFFKKKIDEEAEIVACWLNHGDYTIGQLQKAIQDIMFEHFEDKVSCIFDEESCCFRFCFNDKYKGELELLNLSKDLEQINVGQRTVTRTLGFDAGQKITIQNEKEEVVAARVSPYNLYANNSFCIHRDEIDEAQNKIWNERLKNFRFEINEEVYVSMNSFNTIRCYKGDENKSRFRSIASVSLGAPGLPSKRLLSSEMGSKIPFDSSVRICYFDQKGELLCHRTGFNAQLDLLVQHR